MKPVLTADETGTLACIHCGLCLSSCPTYLETGDENQSPRGRIYLMRALQEERLPLEAGSIRALDLCLGCRACEAVCPSGVPYGALLEHTRDHIETGYRRPWLQRLLRRVAIEQVFPYPKRLRLALMPVTMIRALGLERWLPGYLRKILALVPRHREDAPLPSFSAAIAKPSTGTGCRAGFVVGCAMPVLFNRANANTVLLLNRSGFDVVVPGGQGCCGALHAHGGRLEESRRFARRNIEAFERAGVDVIVVNAAGCGSALKEYGALLKEDPEWRDRAREFATKVRDFTEVLALPEAGPRPRSGNRVTYHDACHLAHAQRITQRPRELVKAMAGADYVELPEADLCCGSAGTYNLTEPEMAGRLQRRKADNNLATGARVVVTTNPGCLLQIRAGLDAAGAGQVEVIHLADYLAGSHPPTGRTTTL